MPFHPSATILRVLAAALVALSTISTSASAAEKPKSTEGTFLGIEEGDYAHWKMKTATGKEVSYFILRPDKSVEKVVEKPKQFIGKKCRVQWKSTKENLPEAGGKTQVEQILSVEWLAKS